MHIPPSSKITSISRSKTTTRTSKFTGQAWPISNLMVPYPWHFDDFPSAVNTLNPQHRQRHHTDLPRVCEQPESTRAMHFCSSTSTLMTSSALFFTCSGRRLALTSLLNYFPGTQMRCVQPCCNESNALYGMICMVGWLFVSSRHSCLQSLAKCLRPEHSKQILPSLRIPEDVSACVHWTDAATHSLDFWSLIIMALVWVRSCSMVIFSILDDTLRSCLMSYGCSDTNVHNINHLGKASQVLLLCQKIHQQFSQYEVAFLWTGQMHWRVCCVCCHEGLLSLLCVWSLLLT